MKVKNVRNPAPWSAGDMTVAANDNCNYYVTVRGNKHFYPNARQLIQAALAGVA
jgi:hypothetical protein